MCRYIYHIRISMYSCSAHLYTQKHAYDTNPQYTHNIYIYTHMHLHFIIGTSLTPYTTSVFVYYSDDSIMQMMLCTVASSLESSFAHIVFACPWCQVHGSIAIQVIYLRERVKQAAHRQNQGSPGAATKCRLKNG